jgi:carbon starvation protein
LAAIARTELGSTASTIVSAAILFIVVIALAGLGFVVVKALGGDEIKFAEGTTIIVPAGHAAKQEQGAVYRLPEGCRLRETTGEYPRPESFLVRVPADGRPLPTDPGMTAVEVALPSGSVEMVPGSSWGTFTIACTIPIAFFVGWYMYRFRKGKVVEASAMGALAVLAATVAGNWIPGSVLEPFFSLTRTQTIIALCTYGFVASVLPVWLLLCPRDYLSSYLKIGTIALLIGGVILANPRLTCPALNPVFQAGGPTFKGGLFPFVFICIMCGAISGFHALVASGTTPKMIDRESDIRPIGYGAMLMEGVVGLVALIAAASIDQRLYYDINIDRSEVGKFQKPLNELYLMLGGADSIAHLPVDQQRDLPNMERKVGESLRGRTGGAVTLAVGMALIFDDALRWTGINPDSVIKYWFHFAIMFEALFILTTIDTGTRIGRFMVQEALGKLYPKFEQTDWWPGAVLATLIVTAGWGGLVATGSIQTIWAMFGIANQLLSVLALALVTTLLINTGRARYALVTLLPMLFVATTTLSAASQMVLYSFPTMIASGAVVTGVMNMALTIFVVVCVGLLLLLAVSRWVAVLSGAIKPENKESA